MRTQLECEVAPHDALGDQPSPSSITASNTCLPENALNPAMAYFRYLCQFSLAISFVITTVEYSTEGGTRQHSTGYSIAFSGYTGPADGDFNLTGFPPVVTGEG